ncbi:MAG: hypothetical protein Kow0079_16750 [Vicingaceae bacterium]
MKKITFSPLKLAFLTLLGMTYTIGNTQNVAINDNGAAPNTNAILDVDVSTNNKGVLIPRLTTAQRTGIAGLGAADEGLTVYDTNTNSYWLWDGTQWVQFGMGSGWLITGNSNTTQGTNFVGTTNATGLDFRTGNTLRMRLLNGDQLQTNDGVVTAPFYSFLSDADLGMYRITTNTLGFSTAGVERFRMSTTEAVFNDASNNYDFRVESNGQNDMFVIDASTNRIGFNAGLAPSNPITFNSTGENAWLTYWENSTTVGAAGQFYQTSASNGNRVLMGVTNYSGSTNRAAAVIGLSLNTTTTGSGGTGVEADANNESGVALYASLFYTGTYSGWAGYFNADVFCGGTYFGSDLRLKKNVNKINSALNIVNKLNPVTFNYDIEKYPKAGFEEKLRYGFIAQEVEKVLPNLVKDKNIILNSNTEKKPGMASEPLEIEQFKVVDYVSIVPILTKAIQEQQAIIEEQNNRIDALEKKLEELLNK